MLLKLFCLEIKPGNFQWNGFVCRWTRFNVHLYQFISIDRGFPIAMVEQKLAGILITDLALQAVPQQFRWRQRSQWHLHRTRQKFLEIVGSILDCLGSRWSPGISQLAFGPAVSGTCKFCDETSQRFCKPNLSEYIAQAILPGKASRTHGSLPHVNPELNNPQRTLIDEVDPENTDRLACTLAKNGAHPSKHIKSIWLTYDELRFLSNPGFTLRKGWMLHCQVRTSLEDLRVGWSQLMLHTRVWAGHATHPFKTPSNRVQFPNHHIVTHITCIYIYITIVICVNIYIYTVVIFKQDFIYFMFI